MAKAVASDDYYSVLHVSQFDNISTIRDSYKRLALRYHPDKNNNVSATEDFQKLSVAYETLKDATRRSEYDREYVRVQVQVQVQVAKRSREEDVDDDIACARRRQQEVREQASAQWARHADFSNAPTRHNSPEIDLKRSEKVMRWKAEARQVYSERLQQWEESRDKHVATIQSCLLSIRKQKKDLEKFNKDDEAIEKARLAGSQSEIPGFAEALAKMQQARKVFAAGLARNGRRSCEQLHSLLLELEDERRRYEIEEASARKGQIKEALEIIGPRDLSQPIFSMIDRRGQGINHWKALYRVKLTLKFPSTLEAYMEGPWHKDGEWERMIGEHVCGRCSQNAFHLLAPCAPAKCPGCGLVLCNDCYRDFQLLREYGDWLQSGDGQMLDSLFSLEFDLSRKPFRASWENDFGSILSSVSHFEEGGVAYGIWN